METLAKLFWDFRGPAAQQTANHHLIHLKEYFNNQQITARDTGVESNSPSWFSAYCVVTMEQVETLRNALKPHRGTRFSNHK